MFGGRQQFRLGDLRSIDAADDGEHRFARALHNFGEVDFLLAAGLQQAAVLLAALQTERFQLPPASGGTDGIGSQGWQRGQCEESGGKDEP